MGTRPLPATDQQPLFSKHEDNVPEQLGSFRPSTKAQNEDVHHSRTTESSTRRKASQSQRVDTLSAPSSLLSSNKKVIVRPKPKQFRERETYVKWLASIPEKFKAPSSMNDRPRSRKSLRKSKTSHPTVESQRIGHFLSSLPEEIEGFEDPPRSSPYLEQAARPLDHSQRSVTLPIYDYEEAKKSRSEEDLGIVNDSLSDENVDDQDDNQFVGPIGLMTMHCNSESDLVMASAVSKQPLKEIIEELKIFATTTISLTPKVVAKASQEATLAPPEQPPKNPSDTDSGILDDGKSSVNDQNGLGFDLQSVGGPGLEHLARNMEDHRAREVSSVPPERETGDLPTESERPSLGAWMHGLPKTRKRRWESATVIMDRILDDKASEAPTSVMSKATRAKVSKSRPLLRWNDKSYGYLPHLIKEGKVDGMRQLLNAGCNLGTTNKLRWAPIHNAIIGASDKHTKCLRSLVNHGVDVNAVKQSNGRRPLHYAIERPLWSGYSTVIYTLLAAGADPNARDHANDLPLLMLLVGNGPLPQEKRDALYLLLVPNFRTTLDVHDSGTLDNPLHLAVRRKDPYTVDVILEKMKQDSLDLTNRHNASGFTPLLLAFTTFSMVDDVDEGLRIVKLLLENGANPDDKDVSNGETPLHLVIRINRNPIALELLCRHSASPWVRNKAGQHAMDLISGLQVDGHVDEWARFAENRMTGKLTESDYRPPELVAYLDEEGT